MTNYFVSLGELSGQYIYFIDVYTHAFDLRNEKRTILAFKAKTINSLKASILIWRIIT